MCINEFSVQVFVDYCNETLNYSKIFHYVIGALKLDQIGKFPNYLENSQTAHKGPKIYWESFHIALKIFQMACYVS